MSRNEKYLCTKEEPPFQAFPSTFHAPDAKLSTESSSTFSPYRNNLQIVKMKTIIYTKRSQHPCLSSARRFTPLIELSLLVSKHDNSKKICISRWKYNTPDQILIRRWLAPDDRGHFCASYHLHLLFSPPRKPYHMNLLPQQTPTREQFANPRYL